MVLLSIISLGCTDVSVYSLMPNKVERQQRMCFWLLLHLTQSQPLCAFAKCTLEGIPSHLLLYCLAKLAFQCLGLEETIEWEGEATKIFAGESHRSLHKDVLEPDFK